MRVKRNKAFALVACVAALALAVTGCGGGGAATGDSGSESGDVTVVKIGIGAPITAGSAALGNGMVRATKLAAKLANETDEVKELGIKFEVVASDDMGDPKTGVNGANTLVSDRALVGVVGHLNSGVSIPASEVYARAGIVNVSPAATNPQFTLRDMDNVFRTCATDAVQGPAAADMAVKDMGLKAAFVVDDSTPYGEGLAAEFAKQFAANGATVVGAEKTSDKDTEFSSLVTKIKAANPDLVYYGGMYNAGALLSRQLSDAGVNAPLMGGDGMFDAEFINLAGAAAAEGDFTTNIGAPIEKLPKAAEFVEKWEAEYPNDAIAAYDPLTFDATQTIINAVIEVAKADGVESLFSKEGKAAIIAAVAASDFEGVTGKVSFDENGDTNNKTVTLYTAKDGAWVVWEK